MNKKTGASPASNMSSSMFAYTKSSKGKQQPGAEEWRQRRFLSPFYVRRLCKNKPWFYTESKDSPQFDQHIKAGKFVSINI